MKRRSRIITFVFVLGLSSLLLSYNVVSEKEYESLLGEDTIEIPVEVQSILENKCFECHTSESKGSKSKLKLNFDKFANGDYSNGKLVSKFGKITKQLIKKKCLQKNIWERTLIRN